MNSTEAAAGRTPVPSGLHPFADVLCAVDGTHESLSAVEHAAALTGPAGRLTLLLVTSFRFMGDHRSPAIPPAEAGDLLSRAVDVAQGSGVPYTVEVDPASPPSNVILDWASDHDLLAIGAPATPWFGGMFLGGVAANVETSFTSSLLVARPLPASEERRRILLASDALDGSDELVALGARIARAQQADAVLVHAVGSESASHPHRIEHQARLLEESLGPGRSSVRVEPGSPRRVIVEAARDLGASLIVMSSRRLRGLQAVGSVSRRVVHHGHCPVLLVPPEQLHGDSAPATTQPGEQP
jgi:nucleotide-binding universal stress UspA family protein